MSEPIVPGQLRRFHDDPDFRWSGKVFLVLGDRSHEFDSNYVSLGEIMIDGRVELVTHHMLDSCSTQLA